MSDTVILGIAPTFYLKQIHPLNFPQKYIDGEFKNIDINYIKSNNIKSEVSKVHKQVEIIGSSRLSKLFTLVDRNNNTYVCVTTNNFSEGEESLCNWCRTTFKHSWIGIPYRLEYTDDNSTYYTDGIFCCFECAAAELRNYSKTRLNRFHGQYVTADILLESLYNKVYPGKKLIPSPHFSLHEKNGGALSDKDYYSQRSIYVEMTGVVLLPTKRVSLQIPYL